ncbi:MAG: hypothetical protein ACYC0H_16770, partial [Solirubrobacteraceae bacterium]
MKASPIPLVGTPAWCSPAPTRSWLALETAPEITSAPAAAATRGRRISRPSSRGVRGGSGAGPCSPPRCKSVADSAGSVATTARDTSVPSATVVANSGTHTIAAAIATAMKGA